MVSSELGDLIDRTPWIDTHEHLVEESSRLVPGIYSWPEAGAPAGASGHMLAIASDWTALLSLYAIDDLRNAGLREDEASAFQGEDLGPLEKWDLVAPFIAASRATGYLRAVDVTTERLFGMRLCRNNCKAIDTALRELRSRGYYRQVLRDVGNVVRCHVNSLEHNPFCETESPDLLQQDLSLVPLALGRHEAAESRSGIEVGSLDDYLSVIDRVFASDAPRAVAAKCAWAYRRPLAMDAPTDPPERAFARLRAETASTDERRTVEDFLMQRCLERATAYGLPVKIHLGYLAGVGLPPFRHVFSHVEDIAPVVQANPATQFVLMHMAWPSQERLLALAKHSPNVTVDLCWSWIVAPLATRRFVEQFLTTVPSNKLLCFGGDYTTVETVVGHAEIARRGLQGALESLVATGWITIDDALDLVPALMHGNAEQLFPARLADGSTAPTVESSIAAARLAT